MAVSIRLRRMGRKKKAFYRIVVADERNPRQGLFIDDLGYYDPMLEPAQVEINEEKALTWLKQGAKPTDTVRTLLSKAGILRKIHAETHSLDLEEDSTETVESPQEEDEKKEKEEQVAEPPQKEDKKKAEEQSDSE